MAIRTSIDHRPNRARNSRARWQHMWTLEWEPRRAVIKLSIRPKNRVVAGRTHRGRKPRGNVVRHSTAKCRGAIPGRLVAPIAIRVGCGEGVVVPHVTIGAGHDFARRRQLVRAGQRPASRGVIKDRRGPSNGVVAGGAIGRCKWRSSAGMHRIVGLLPRRQVASRISAVIRLDRQIVIIVDVAGSAAGHLAAIGYKRMRICERKAERSVVKLAVRPLRDRVASRAGRRCRREARGNVVRHSAGKGRRAVPSA